MTDKSAAPTTQDETPKGDQYFYVKDHPILKNAEVVKAEDYDRLKAALNAERKRADEAEIVSVGLENWIKIWRERAERAEAALAALKGKHERLRELATGLVKVSDSGLAVFPSKELRAALEQDK
jgi:hypothetical protein